MEQGDYKYRTNIKSGDEIGELSTAFDSMAGKLTGIYRNLDTQVKQRTKDLEAANEQLAQTEAEHRTSLGMSERTNNAMIGRELKMIELKKENMDLKKKLGR